MRFSMFAALIAATSLVSPALAQDRHRGGDRSERRAERPQRDYSQQRQRGTSTPTPGPSAQTRTGVAPTPVPQLQQRPQYRPSGTPNGYRQDRRPGGTDARPSRYPGQQRPDTGRPSSGWQDSGRDRGGERPDSNRYRGGDRPDSNRYRGGDRPDASRYRDNRPDYRQQRPSAQRPTQQRRYNDWRDDSRYRADLSDRRNWSNNWRRDRRYDYNNYRRSNRNVYRLPRYYAPRGYSYGYRRFSIGLTIGSMLFAPSYWINDPFYYRLPPAYGPYRWVRYYNDALLVDIRSGTVVDVVYDIFW